MLTDYQAEWKKKKTHSNGCESHRHYAYTKCLPLKSSFVMQLFIATSIMASTSPNPSVNILNDRINNGQSLVDFVSETRPESIEEQILLNEHEPLLASKKVNNKGHSWSKALTSSSSSSVSSATQPFMTVTELAVSKDKSKYPLSCNNPVSCVCTNRKSSCWKMCEHAQQHNSKNQQHNRFINRMCKHKQDDEMGRVHTGPEHVKSSTLIFGNTVIKNGVKSNQHHALIQSIGMHAAKFHVKPHNNRTTHSQLKANRKLYNRNAHGINKGSRIHASFHSHKINSHSEMTDENVQIMNANRSNRIETDKTLRPNEKIRNAMEQTVNNVKRKTRSVIDSVQFERRDVKDAFKWQVSRKNAKRRETTANESIGSSFGGNGITDLTVSSSTQTSNVGDGIEDDDDDGGDSVNGSGDDTVHVEYPFEDSSKVRNLTMNLVRTELSIKPVEGWLVANTLRPINDKATNSSSVCSDSISCKSEVNDTCVGEPEYCNLTEVEYLEMLYDYIFPTPGEWVLIGFHAAVFLVGLIGNILVCIAVYANATMRTVTNIFIVNLAIADLLVIILCLPPTVVWDVTETWFLGEAMCKGILYLQTVSVTVSVLTLTFISIDRWYAICFPLQYVSTNGRAWCSIGLIWIGALLSDIPEFINSTTKKKELRFGIDLFTQCVSTWDKDTEKNFYIARFAVLYALPLFLMSIAYFKIICVLWKSDTIPGHRESCNQTHTIHTRNTVGNSSTMSQLRARRKAAKMLVVVVVMFAICYLPVHCLNILRYTIDIAQNEVIAILSLISHWLCYANSAVNPLIYNFMSGKFRREFVSVLERCRCNNRDIHRHHSCYFNTPGVRLNTISPNSRSLCHFVSHRERNKSFREKHTIQTSFIENVCDIYPNGIDDGQGFGINGTNGVSRTVPTNDRLPSTMD